MKTLNRQNKKNGQTATPPVSGEAQGLVLGGPGIQEDSPSIPKEPKWSLPMTSQEEQALASLCMKWAPYLLEELDLRRYAVGTDVWSYCRSRVVSIFAGLARFRFAFIAHKVKDGKQVPDTLHELVGRRIDVPGGYAFEVSSAEFLLREVFTRQPGRRSTKKAGVMAGVTEIHLSCNILWSGTRILDLVVIRTHSCSDTACGVVVPPQTSRSVCLEVPAEPT